LLARHVLVSYVLVQGLLARHVLVSYVLVQGLLARHILVSYVLQPCKRPISLKPSAQAAPKDAFVIDALQPRRVDVFSRCVQALSKRIHYGKFVAEAKFLAKREEYSSLIRARDADGLMKLLTDEAVEAKVCTSQVCIQIKSNQTKPNQLSRSC